MQNDDVWHVQYHAERYHSENTGKGWLPVMGGDKTRTFEEALAYYRQCRFPIPNRADIYRFFNPVTGEVIPAIITEIM